MSEQDHSALNARLRELANEGVYSHDDWVRAAMYLGDKAEAVWPAVEQIARVYHPVTAARLALHAGGAVPRE